jgi:hypothetical protein
VSYDVGFVRRGLVGSPMLALTTQLALPPERIGEFVPRNLKNT